MFDQCADPKTLEGLAWLLCYLSSGKHILFYLSFGTVLLLLAITAPIALLFGFGGALASRSRFAPLRWFGRIYSSMVRGVPDIIFFLFVPIALDQGFEWLRAKAFGGGRMFEHEDVLSVGKRNSSFAKYWLENNGIPLELTDFHGSYSRKLVFYPATGQHLCLRTPTRFSIAD